MKRGIAMLMLGLTATGCASAQPHPNRGTIVDKNYINAHWEQQMPCLAWKKGKSHSDDNCTKWDRVRYKWHDDEYELRVIYPDGTGKDVTVSKVIFTSYKIGDSWSG